MPKKKTALTIEERLQQALVPEEEQPYELPENWVWCRLLNSVNHCLDNYRKPVNSTERANRIGNIPYYGATGQVGWIDDYLTNEHLVLLGEDGAPFLDLLKEKAYIISGKAWVNNHAHILKSTFGEVGNIFLKHYLNTVDYRDYVKGTTRLKLTQGSMLLMPFPLPPLAEQQRIVDRIEELFAKLDEAKEKLQEVVDSFAVRKAAILHKAFTGELTQKWRKENGVELGSWEEKKFGEIGVWIGGGTPSTSHEEYWKDGNVMWITSKDMKFSVIEDTVMKVNEEGIKNSSANYIDKPALLVVMRSGILRRTFPVAIVRKPFTVNQDLKAIVPDKDDLKFLLFMVLNNEQRILNTCMKNGTTVESINSKALRDFSFMSPPLTEQHEIVRLIDKLLARERKAQQAAKQALADIELMKKAILAKAFRGELGTNRASEASAMELLRQVLTEENGSSGTI